MSKRSTNQGTTELKGRLTCTTAVLIAVFALIPLLWPSPTHASLPAMDAEAILARVDASMHILSRFTEQTMILANDRGQERSRTVVMWSKRFDGLDHMLLRFTEPGNVRGTAFLVVGDDMWLYLPSLGRTRRIAGHAKNGNFMGSDFSYHDMEQMSAGNFGEAYVPTLEGVEERQGEETYRLQLQGTGNDPVYTHLVMWVSPEYWLPRRIDYFVGETKVKSLATDRIQAVDGRWTAREITMEDPEKGTFTRLIVDDVSFDQPIDEGIFTVQNLERGGR